MRYLIYLLLKTGIYSISILPFWVLHAISTFLYWNVYYLFDYRKKVVTLNLKNSFPEKSDKEIKAISKAFYKHFCDILIESLKAFTISEEEVQKRHHFTNPELLEKYLAQGRSLAVIGPHYNNWEWFILSLNFLGSQRKPNVLIMYAVLKNPHMERLIKESRSRMGTIMFPKKDTLRQIAHYKNEPYMLCFAADQAPG